MTERSVIDPTGYHVQSNVSDVVQNDMVGKTAQDGAVPADRVEILVAARMRERDKRMHQHKGVPSRLREKKNVAVSGGIRPLLPR